jgi:hypothetical protein
VGQTKPEFEAETVHGQKVWAFELYSHSRYVCLVDAVVCLSATQGPKTTHMRPSARENGVREMHVSGGVNG